MIVRGDLYPTHHRSGAVWNWVLPAITTLLIILSLNGFHLEAPFAGNSSDSQVPHATVSETVQTTVVSQHALPTDSCIGCADHVPVGGMALLCGMILFALIGLAFIWSLRQNLAQLLRPVPRIVPPLLPLGDHLRPSLVSLSISRT